MLEDQHAGMQSISISLKHRKTTHTFDDFPPTATVADLAARIEHDLALPVARQTFMITPGFGMLKAPFATANPLLDQIQACRIVLLAPTAEEIAKLAPNPTPSAVKTALPNRRPDWQRIKDDATYTFHAILPLPHLQHPARSRQFLERLRDDPGIKAAMRRHRFSVAVLTEMDPAEHTTHDSRTLGLNRNKGEAIELRLRTDAYDGYRDYYVIRSTLCHELAHCVFSDHDRQFWDLTKQIEGEVRQSDWKSGGQTLGSEVFYDPEARNHVDAGGWHGGDFVLGGTSSTNTDRRELLAKAAESRAKASNVGKPG